MLPGDELLCLNFFFFLVNTTHPQKGRGQLSPFIISSASLIVNYNVIGQNC